MKKINEEEKNKSKEKKLELFKWPGIIHGKKELIILRMGRY